MTEIAIPHHDQNMPALFDPTGGRLTAWALSLDAAHRIGTALCSTAFAPAHFKGKPDDAAAAILFGDEIGLSPTQALRSIYVVNGNPGLSARQMVALVLHHGHEVWTVEKNDSKVTVAGKRRGSNHVTEETWTIARAQKAGYTKNAKYQSTPQDMLYARAAGDVCRQIAPDALSGLAYSIEEMELDQAPATVTVVRSGDRPTTARRKPIDPPPAAAEPELEAPEPPAPPVADVRSEAQSRKMFATAREAGISNDELRPFINSVVGREVESSKTLTKAEAGKVIEALEVAIAEPGVDVETGEILDAELVEDSWPAPAAVPA